jgi:hypothetical protein
LGVQADRTEKEANEKPGWPHHAGISSRIILLTQLESPTSFSGLSAKISQALFALPIPGLFAACRNLAQKRLDAVFEVRESPHLG